MHGYQNRKSTETSLESDIARVYMIQVYLHDNAGLKYIHVHTRTESSR